MEGFKERIRSLIASETAAGLAKRLGVSRAAIYLYAKGQTPSVGVIEKVGGTIRFPSNIRQPK